GGPDVEFLQIEHGDVFEALLQIGKVRLIAERLDDIGAHQPHVHAAQIQDIARIIATAPDGQDAQIVAIADGIGNIVGKAQIGACHAATNDGDGVGVHSFLVYLIRFLSSQIDRCTDGQSIAEPHRPEYSRENIRNLLTTDYHGSLPLSHSHA